MDRKRAIGVAIIAVMVAAALFGVASGEADWDRSRIYWMGVTVLFGFGTLALVWLHQEHGMPTGATLLRLGAHWLGVLAVVVITFFLVANNQITHGQAGLMLSLILALGTFLCGVYFDWRLVGVGAALAMVAPASAFLEENAIILVLIGVVALVIVLGGDALRRRRASHSETDARA